MSLHIIKKYCSQSIEVSEDQILSGKSLEELGIKNTNKVPGKLVKKSRNRQKTADKKNLIPEDKKKDEHKSKEMKLISQKID